MEKLSSNQVKLTVTVSAEEFDKAMNTAYGKLKGRLSVPGFRKGKAPRKVIENYYGAGVLTVFVFYFFHGREWWKLLGQILALYWINVRMLGGQVYPMTILGMDVELSQQGLALLALVPIWLYRGRQGHHSKAFQYACYAFYPVHMLILALILRAL